MSYIDGNKKGTFVMFKDCLYFALFCVAAFSSDLYAQGSPTPWPSTYFTAESLAGSTSLPTMDPARVETNHDGSLAFVAQWFSGSPEDPYFRPALRTWDGQDWDIQTNIFPFPTGVNNGVQFFPADIEVRIGSDDRAYLAFTLTRFEDGVSDGWLVIMSRPVSGGGWSLEMFRIHHAIGTVNPQYNIELILIDDGSGNVEPAIWSQIVSTTLTGPRMHTYRYHTIANPFGAVIYTLSINGTSGQILSGEGNNVTVWPRGVIQAKAVLLDSGPAVAVLKNQNPGIPKRERIELYTYNSTLNGGAGNLEYTGSPAAEDVIDNHFGFEAYPLPTAVALAYRKESGIVLNLGLKWGSLGYVFGEQSVKGITGESSDVFKHVWDIAYDPLIQAQGGLGLAIYASTDQFSYYNPDFGAQTSYVLRYSSSGFWSSQFTGVYAIPAEVRPRSASKDLRFVSNTVHNNSGITPTVSAESVQYNPSPAIFP